MNSLSHSAKRRTMRGGWCMALTVAVFSSGCSTFGPSPVGGFTPLAELLPVALGGNRGLCVGLEGTTSLCAPGPKPRLEVEGLRVNLRQPIEGVLPSHVLCRIKREASQALLECVEIYTGLPN